MHRWNQHCAQAQKSKGSRRWHFPNAIRKYGKDAFSHKVLGVFSKLKLANAAERYWIEYLNTRNPQKGFNLAPGGDHVPHPVNTDYWKDPAYIAGQSKRMKALWKDSVWVLNNRAANKAALNTPESKAKRSLASKEVRSRPEVIEAMNVLKGRKLSSERCRQIGLVQKGKTLSLEHRAKIAVAGTGRRHTKSAKLKVSVANKGKTLSLEHRAKIAAAHLKTYCKRGHSLSDAYIRNNGERICRVCCKNWKKRKSTYCSSNLSNKEI